MQALGQRLKNAPTNPWPDRPIPIVLAITDLDVGGAERSLVALAQGLNRTRFEPTVICLGPEAELAGPLRQAGITTNCLGVSQRNPAAAYLKTVRALRTAKPALIQSFLFHANFLTRMAAPLAGTPWVLGGIRVAERRREWHLLLDSFTQRFTAGQVCVSIGVERYTRMVGRLASERLCVIPNGVDPARFDRAAALDRTSLGIPNEANLTLYVGRLDAQKGLSTLLESARNIVRERPDWHLVMVGDGPLKPQLHAQAESLGLSGRVHWLGRRSDIPELLKTADLLVLPSLWEGMPNVVLEAMAAGRAVVGSRVEGTEDLVIPDRTGWLVPPGDVDSLTEALRDAASNPDRLRAYGNAGRARVEAEFAPARVIESYERLWAGVLGLRSPDA